ncbi:MAG: hypothetical protein P4L10_16285 [Acidobacteriaceae bacterium]|nr:hypothetical protein [Acidobacteriaceae bacterium]
MRLTIAYTSLLVAALFCCQGINAYTPYSGLRLMLNNDFLKSTAKTLMPKLFTMVHEMIQPPNSTRICAPCRLLPQLQLLASRRQPLHREPDQQLAFSGCVDRNL